MDKGPPIVETPPICEAPPIGGSTLRQTPANRTWLESMRERSLGASSLPMVPASCWELSRGGAHLHSENTDLLLFIRNSAVAKNKVAGVL